MNNCLLRGMQDEPQFDVRRNAISQQCVALENEDVWNLSREVDATCTGSSLANILAILEPRLGLCAFASSRLVRAPSVRLQCIGTSSAAKSATAARMCLVSLTANLPDTVNVSVKARAHLTARCQALLQALDQLISTRQWRPRTHGAPASAPQAHGLPLCGMLMGL